MTAAFDLIVIGAGPAGGMAALAAARHGLSVALLDEAAAPGGQVYRAPADGLRAPPGQHDADALAGHALRRDVAASQVTWLPSRRVWSVALGYRVDVVGTDGHAAYTAPRLIAATGAHERVIPFPGWTLPGVIGLAAATILLKSQSMLPGRRTVVAGCGPLLAAVAAEIVAAGGTVVAIVDTAHPRDWLAALPRMLGEPRLLLRGAGWALSLKRARVPVYFGHAIRAAQGGERIEGVRIGPVDRSGAATSGPAIACATDALVVGNGLVPGGEIPRLLRAAMTYSRRRGGWIPKVDGFGRTSLPGLFAVGDGAGIRGAKPALLAGEIAGLTAALDAGCLTQDEHADQTAPLRRQLASYAPFADAMAGLMALQPAQVASIPPETIVCRCENISRQVIEAAARSGAHDVNQLKHFTRCGMGPCQGRMCGDVAAEILARTRRLPRASVGYWTGRPPLRPVPLEDLVGDFDYSDIPIPKPAPL